MNIDDQIKVLNSWYHNHTDGDWEQHLGLTIESTDNPGWMLKMDVLLGDEFKSKYLNIDYLNSNSIEGIYEKDKLFLFSVNLSDLIFSASKILLLIEEQNGERKRGHM